MEEPFLFSFFVLAALYLCVIVHEAGHAFIGRASGFVVTSVGLGTAGPFFVLPIGRTRLYLGLIQPFQGITFAFLPRLYPNRRILAAFMSGGIVANAFFAAGSLSVALCLPTGRPATFFRVSATINALIATISLLPVRYRVGGAILRSDGRLLLEILRTGSFMPPPADVIQTAQGCRRLWQAVDDRRMERIYTLSATLSWIDLGSSTKAESCFSEALAIDAAHPYIDWLEEITRANLALAKGELTEASDALTRAENSGEPAGSEGHDLLALLRASLLLGEGRQGEALEAFEGLSRDPMDRTHPEIGMSALVGHLRAACVVGDPATASSLRGRYATARRSYPSDVRDLLAYRALARLASSSGADPRDDYRRALEAAAALAAPFRDPHDRAAFADAQKGLIEEARQALGAESAGLLIEATVSQRPDRGFMSEAESCRRWAIRILLVNVVAFVPLILVALALRPRGLPAFLLSLFLAFFTLVGTVWLLLDLAVVRLLPSLKHVSGAILLVLAVMPWLGGLLSLVFSTIMP